MDDSGENVVKAYYTLPLKSIIKWIIMCLAWICLGVHVLTRHIISDIILHKARPRLTDGSLPVPLPELVWLHGAHLGHDRLPQWVLSGRHSSPPRVCGRGCVCQALYSSCVLATCPSAGLLFGESGGSGHCHPLTHCSAWGLMLFALFTICRRVALTFIPSFLPFTSPSVPLCSGGPAPWWMMWFICHHWH